MVLQAPSPSVENNVAKASSHPMVSKAVWGLLKSSPGAKPIKFVKRTPFLLSSLPHIKTSSQQEK
jgi:hypothetical protein